MKRSVCGRPYRYATIRGEAGYGEQDQTLVRFTCLSWKNAYMTKKRLAIGFVLALSIALAGEVQAAEAPGDSAASLSIKGVNIKVVNSSACTLNASLGVGKHFISSTLPPGDSIQSNGSGLPVGLNVTEAKIIYGEDCQQQMRAEAVVTNPQIGEPFCVCMFDSSTWRESFSVNQSRALRDGTVALLVTRNKDTSNFKNFTMTVSGNAEKTLQARPAPASALVRRTADRKALRVRITPKPGRGKTWRFRVQKRQSGTWKSLPGTYRSRGTKTVRTEALGRGTYRVRVLAGNGVPGSSSRARRLVN